MISHVAPAHFPRCPRGIRGVRRDCASCASWTTLSSGDDASSTVRHCGQTTVSACPKPRNSTGPPQLGQNIALALATGGPTKGEDIRNRSRSCPPLELPDILELQRFIRHCLADKQHRRGRIAIIER